MTEQQSACQPKLLGAIVSSQIFTISVNVILKKEKSVPWLSVVILSFLGGATTILEGFEREGKSFRTNWKR